jgi:hypothetical protein
METTPINVMYFGMAIDIVGPMQLVPDFDTIYTINTVDPCIGYGGSIKNIIKIIKIILETGKNIYALPEGTDLGLFSDDINIIIDVVEPSIIINETFYDYDNNIINEINISEEKPMIKWHLKFNYDGKIRNLIYYFNYNFTCEWPRDIANINHFLFQGSYDFNYLKDAFGQDEDDNTFKYRDAVVIDMIETRSSLPAFIYTLEVFNPLMPYKKRIKYCSFEASECVSDIAYIKYDTFTPDWWKKSYEK